MYLAVYLRRTAVKKKAKIKIKNKYLSKAVYNSDGIVTKERKNKNKQVPITGSGAVYGCDGGGTSFDQGISPFWCHVP